MKEADLRDCYWSNYRTLARELIPAEYDVISVKWFTARIRQTNPQQQDRAQRQNVFIRACEASDVSPIYGIHKPRDHYCPLCKSAYANLRCPLCGGNYAKNDEKRTDVNIACNLIADAHNDAYNYALLITADDDATPAVLTVKELFPNKFIRVALPPGRAYAGSKLATSAHDHRLIERPLLLKCALPPSIKLQFHTITIPPKWANYISDARAKGLRT